MRHLLTALAIVACALLPRDAVAEYAGYVYPAGGRVGTTCQVVLGGRMLQSIRGVVVDGDLRNRDIVVESVELVPGNLFNMRKSEQRKYVDRWIRAVHGMGAVPKRPEDTAGWDLDNRFLNQVDSLDAVERRILVHDFYTRPDKLQASPSIAQKAIVKLKISPMARKGLRHLRFVSSDRTPYAFNPVPFFVGEDPEYGEPAMLPPPMKPEIPEITLPCAINGQILPGEKDLFRFAASKGKVYTFRLRGRALLPFVGDGVPGHFQPVLQILDSHGREKAFRDDCHFDPDPVLTFTVPEDGSYTLVVRDALFRGREDFVYRVAVTEGPARYRLLPGPGWKLPVRSVAQEEDEIRIETPCVVEGTMWPGKSRKIRFYLESGRDTVLEVYARRALSPLDSLLKVYGPDGRQIAVNDDWPRPKIGPVLHSADSYVRFRAASDGVYTAEISDISGAGGEDYRWWLRIGPPRPDFRVWCFPSYPVVSGFGGATPLAFVTERLDGFEGDIEIQVVGTKSVFFSGSHILPHDSIRGNSFESVCGQELSSPACGKEYLTLRPALKSPAHREQLKLMARSGGIVHPVVPADEYMQAFAYNHLIEADDLMAGVQWNIGVVFEWASGTAKSPSIRPGGELELKAELKSMKRVVEGTFSAELLDPPAGLSLTGFRQEGKNLFLRLKADASMKPGRFNQVVRLYYMRPVDRPRMGMATSQKRDVFLPALTMVVSGSK